MLFTLFTHRDIAIEIGIGRFAPCRCNSLAVLRLQHETEVSNRTGLSLAFGW